MALFCRKSLSPLQRRSLTGFCGMVGGAGGITIIVHDAMEHARPSRAGIYGLAGLAAVPVGALIFIAGRYLARETDEFVRMLVVKAMLWGFGVTMVADTVYSYLAEYAGFGRVNGMLQMLNIDVFCVAAAVALRLMARGYASGNESVSESGGYE
jgi:hypothetical protein